jgi:hypothetical protein
MLQETAAAASSTTDRLLDRVREQKARATKAEGLLIEADKLLSGSAPTPKETEKKPPPKDTCDCPGCQEVLSGRSVLIKTQDADAMRNHAKTHCVCGLLDGEVLCNNVILLVLCILFGVLGWGCLIAAAAYSSAVHDPVGIHFRHVAAPLLWTFGLLVSIGYAPPESERIRAMRHQADELDGLPDNNDTVTFGFLATDEEQRNELMMKRMRTLALVAAALFCGIGAFLGVFFACYDWLTPPTAPPPPPPPSSSDTSLSFWSSHEQQQQQPSQVTPPTTPGVMMLLLDLAFLLAVTCRYFSIQVDELEKESALRMRLAAHRPRM